MRRPDFVIRLADAADIAEAAALFERVSRAAMHWIAPQDQTADLFLGFARDETVWVAVAGNAVIGTASLYEPESFLHSLYVDQAWQGRGVGATLMEAAAQRARAPLSLKVQALNGPARGFYARRGFIETDRGVSDGWEWVRLTRA